MTTDIRAYVISGNLTMIHLLLAEDPSGIRRVPSEPFTLRFSPRTTAGFGWPGSDTAFIHSIPAAGGWVVDVVDRPVLVELDAQAVVPDDALLLPERNWRISDLVVRVRPALTRPRHDARGSQRCADHHEPGDQSVMAE